MEVNDTIKEDKIPVPEQPENELIWLRGCCNDKEVIIMLDSGSTVNVVYPGTSKRVTKSQLSQVTRSDGSKTEPSESKRGHVTLWFEGHKFPDVDVMEWSINKEYDVILGEPWFARFEPIIN